MDGNKSQQEIFFDNIEHIQPAPLPPCCTSPPAQPPPPVPN